MNLRQGRRKLWERYSLRICLVRWGGGKLLISFFLLQGVGRERAPVLLCTAHFNLIGLQLGADCGHESRIMSKKVKQNQSCPAG